jgi:hypothetical protein
MGLSSSSSIHPEVVTSIEVSFTDKKGNLLSSDEIKRISEKACKEFDYHPSFYNAYKFGKDGKGPYDEYSRKLQTKLIR